MAPGPIAVYHDLLSDAVAADTQAELEAQTRLHGMYFGSRPVCSVLRPRFLTVEQDRFLRERVAGLLPAFRRIYDAAMSNPEFRRQFGLRPEEDALLADDPGIPDPSPTARLDAFLVGDDGLKFTEYNAETPAGAGYNDALSDIFLGLPILRRFLRRYHVQPIPARPHVLHALLDSYEQFCGHRSARPTIAILDWSDVPTASEFRVFERYFHDRGLAARIVDPREVEYSNGRLRADDFVITLIYKRVLISELLERGGLEHPVVRAVRDRAVCMVNGFRCKILYKKASLAVLSDERNAAMFSDVERRLIAEHIPWTRVVAERTTEHAGRPVDLVPYILSRREQFVLKPNDEYGGKGIVLGWTVDPATWDAAVAAALREPFVVQEKIDLPREPYPSWIDGRVQLIDRMVDTNPFVGGSATMDGCLTRISTEALLNVTAGGGSTVPTFVVSER